MSIKIQILIIIYFIANSFLAGYNFGADFQWKQTKKEKIGFIIICFFSSIGLFIPFFLIIEIAGLVNRPLRFINNYFQIDFFISYLRNKFDKLDLDKLERLNKVLKIRNTNKINDKIYRYCIKLINKRNNYQPN